MTYNHYTIRTTTLIASGNCHLSILGEIGSDAEEGQSEVERGPARVSRIEKSKTVAAETFANDEPSSWLHAATWRVTKRGEDHRWS